MFLLKNIIISLISFVLLLCCSNNNHENYKKNHYNIIDSTKANLIKNAQNINEILEVKRIVNLEVKGNNWISGIENISSLDDKYLLLFDKKADKLHLFTSEGQYLRTIGQQGEGPNEYNQIYSFYYSNNYIYIFSYPKLLIYNIDGSINKSINITKNNKPFYMHRMIIYDNLIYAYQNDQWGEEGDILVFSIDTEKIEDRVSFNLDNYGFGTSLFAKMNNKILITGAFEENVYAFNMDTKKSNVLMKRKQRKLPEQLKNLKYSDEKIMWIIQNKNKMEGIYPSYTMNIINDFIFISKVIESKGYVYEVYDINGTFLNSFNLFDEKIFEKTKIFSKDEFIKHHFSDTGLILSGYSKENGENSNPTLIFYEIKKTKNNQK